MFKFPEKLSVISIKLRSTRTATEDEVSPRPSTSGWGKISSTLVRPIAFIHCPLAENEKLEEPLISMVMHFWAKGNRKKGTSWNIMVPSKTRLCGGTSSSAQKAMMILG